MNPTRKTFFQAIVVAAAVLAGAGIAVRQYLYERDYPQPYGVWNDSDAPATVALVGASGQAFFVVPAHGIVTVSAPAGIGEVERLAEVGGDCQVASGGNTFPGGSREFSEGGQALVSGGHLAGGSRTPPAPWAKPLEPVPCPAAP